MDGATTKVGSANGYVTKGLCTNNNSIGIEGCQDTSTGANVWYWQFHVNTYVQMLLATIAYQEKYGIPDSKVVRHYDVSGKTCPGNWQYNNWARWTQFKKDLADIKTAMKTGVTPTATETKETSTNDENPNVENMYEIAVGDTLGAIARKFNTSVAKLAEWNNIENVNLIYPQTKIYVADPKGNTVVRQNESKSITQNGKTVPTQGAFKFNTTVNVRNQPSATGSVPAQYYANEIVYFDSVVESNGYIWLGYKSNNGRQRYVAAGTRSIAYGTFI